MNKTKKGLAALLAAVMILLSGMCLSVLAAAPDVAVSKSSNTAVAPDGTEVHYLESMTFTLPAFQDEYLLYLYVDSQIMGVQFCDGSGSATSNHPDEATPYKAVLKVDWTNAKKENGVITPEASLSCFVNAMGGIEFGEKLLTGMTVKKAANGDYSATLSFTDDKTLTIYTVNAHIFVNADKAPVGFYDVAGKLHTVNTADSVHTDQSTVPENLKDTEAADAWTELNFIQKIIAFFRKIIDFFSNLFTR